MKSQTKRDLSVFNIYEYLKDTIKTKKKTDKETLKISHCGTLIGP